MTITTISDEFIARTENTRKKRETWNFQRPVKPLSRVCKFCGNVDVPMRKIDEPLTANADNVPFFYGTCIKCFREQNV